MSEKTLCPCTEVCTKDQYRNDHYCKNLPQMGQVPQPGKNAPVDILPETPILQAELPHSATEEQARSAARCRLLGAIYEYLEQEGSHVSKQEYQLLTKLSDAYVHALTSSTPSQKS